MQMSLKVILNVVANVPIVPLNRTTGASVSQYAIPLGVRV